VIGCGTYKVTIERLVGYSLGAATVCGPGKSSYQRQGQLSFLFLRGR